MQNLQINQQKSADKQWINEAGERIPYDRVRASERLNEKKLAPLAKERMSLRIAMEKHKEKCFAIGNELYAAFIAENGGKAPKSKGKGNISRHSFDRSIKIEINVNEAIAFDESLLQLAKDKLDELLNDGLVAAKEWIKPIVMDAFSTSGGTLDTKRVLGLRRHAENITDPRYREAMAFIDRAITKPSSKQYFSLYVKNEKDEYVDVHLNFSNI
jgi:hypothetical protein